MDPRPARHDIALLFAARSVRMFGYGLLAVVLVLYLDAIGLSGGQIGLLLALTLLGDVVISLWLTTHADRLGRRRVLVVGAMLLLAAGLVFAATPVFVVLLVAATIGVISPSGNEVGPFLAVEQAVAGPAGSTSPTHPSSSPATRWPGRSPPPFGALAAGLIVAWPSRSACPTRPMPTARSSSATPSWASSWPCSSGASHRPSRFRRPRSTTRPSARASGCIARSAWSCGSPRSSRSMPSPADSS